GGNVLHLETLRSRRLDEYRARVRLEVRRDAWADQRIVIGRLDSHPLEDAVAKRSRWAVGAVGHKNMVAGLEDRDEGGRDRRQTRRHQHGSRAAFAFQPRQRVFQRFRGRRPAAAVLVAPTVRDLIRRGRIKNRGRVIDGRIDEAEIVFGIAPPGYQPRGGFEGTLAGFLAHGLFAGKPALACIDAKSCKSRGRRIFLGIPANLNPLTLLFYRSVMRTDKDERKSSRKAAPSGSRRFRFARLVQRGLPPGPGGARGVLSTRMQTVSKGCAMKRTVAMFALAAALGMAASPASAQTLNSVKTRGMLNCGANGTLAGFGLPDAQ